MLFATYQPGSMIEDLAAGKIEPYTVWAVPAENLEDLFLSLFCCAPNRMEALIFFECDNYIRIDKVKWYQALKENNKDRTLNPRDYASDDVDDLHSEFLVETITPEQIDILAPIFEVGESADIIERGSLKLEGGPAEFMKMQAKKICSELNFSVQENVQLGMSENYAAYRSEFQPKKMAFELVYLPLAYRLLTAEPGQFTVNVAHMVYMFSYHARDYYRLNNDFTRWSLEDCSLRGFDEIMERMRRCILDSAEVAERVVSGIPIGRNDPCPCGSGKKYKKCHGMWA